MRPLSRWSFSRARLFVLQINRENLAWCAGLFDGEGWISPPGFSATGSLSHPITIGLGQKHPEVINRFRGFVGIGTIYEPKKRVISRTPMYVWKACGFEKVQAVVALLWEWLGTLKREKAILCLGVLKSYEPRRSSAIIPETALAMHELLLSGERRLNIANKFGVSINVVAAVAQGRSFPEITGRKYARKIFPDHCANGHQYSKENTWTNARGWRFCKQCNRDRASRNRASQKRMD